jgi:hypothetical protein
MGPLLNLFGPPDRIECRSEEVSFDLTEEAYQSSSALDRLISLRDGLGLVENTVSSDRKEEPKISHFLLRRKNQITRLNGKIKRKREKYLPESIPDYDSSCFAEKMRRKRNGVAVLVAGPEIPAHLVVHCGDDMNLNVGELLTRSPCSTNFCITTNEARGDYRALIVLPSLFFSQMAVEA